MPARVVVGAVHVGQARRHDDAGSVVIGGFASRQCGEARQPRQRALGHRIFNDPKIIDAAFATEIKVMERRLEIKPEGVQAILEEVAKTDPRAKTIKAQEMIDRRYLDEMAKNGFFDKLWASK